MDAELAWRAIIFTGGQQGKAGDSIPLYPITNERDANESTPVWLGEGAGHTLQECEEGTASCTDYLVSG